MRSILVICKEYFNPNNKQNLRIRPDELRVSTVDPEFWVIAEAVQRILRCEFWLLWKRC